MSARAGDGCAGTPNGRGAGGRPRAEGRGVPEEDRARVLAPMVRLDKRVPGLGLGLATVHRVVTANGGDVGLEAREGGGTSVWFTLPGAAGAGASGADA